MDTEFEEVGGDHESSSVKISTWNPAWTTGIGVLTSMLLGYLVFGKVLGEGLVEYILKNKVADPGNWAFIGFWPAFLVGAAALFLGGLTSLWIKGQEGVTEKGEIKIGYIGVLKILGHPTGIFLGPGLHWIVPLITGVSLINTLIVTTEPREVENLLSADNIAMEVEFFLKLQIEDPRLWLTIDGPEDSILDIADQEIRLVVSTGMAMDLNKRTAAAHESVAARVLREIREDGRRFGYSIKRVFIPKIQPPKAILEAAANKAVENEQRQSEKIEMDALIERVRELKAVGYTAEEARIFLQIERGKIEKPSIKIRQFEVKDADKIADAITSAINTIFGRR